MQCHRFSHSPAFVAGLLATAFATPAIAVEADVAGERLSSVLEQQQIELDYGSAQLEGSDVVLNNVTLSSTGVEGRLSLDELVLRDVIEEPNGDYRVGTIALDSYESEMGEMTFSLIDFTMSGLVLPENIESDRFGGVMRYDRAEAARIDIENDEGPIASFDEVYFDMAVEDDDTLDMTGAVESFSLDLATMMDDENTAEMLAEMEYDQLSGSALMEGSWRPSDGRMTLSRYEAVIDDAGTLSVSLDFSGYTPEFVRALEETTSKLEQQGSGENNSMQGMAMLGLMQQLTFHSASIRFNDDTLTEKVLQRMADRRDSTPDELITQTRSTLSQQLSPVLGNELAGTVSQTVGTFLENPENIEISAQPANPVPFAMLMGAAMGSPETLVQQLGLSITANQ